MGNLTTTLETFRRADNLLTADIDGELVMMNVEQGRYFNLNLVGSRIWELLATPMTVDRLVDALTDEYDIVPAAARQKTESFLDDLRQRELLAVVETTAA